MFVRRAVQWQRARLYRRETLGMNRSAERRDDSALSPVAEGPATSGTATADAPIAPDTTAILRHVVTAARALVVADGAAISLYDSENGRFMPTAPGVAVGLDERWLQRQGLEAAQTLAERAAGTRDITMLLDTATAPDLEFPLLTGGRRPMAVCAAPLEVAGSVVGVIELYDATPRSGPYPQEALRAFADLAGLAIANATAHEQERILRSRLEALDAATRALSAELSADRVLQRIVEIAAQLVGARYGALGVVGDDGYLSEFITTGLSSEEREKIGPLPRGHGLLGVLIRQGQSLRVPDIGRDPRRVGFPPHHPPMSSLLGVPIRFRDEVVGDLYLTDKIGAPEFSDEDQHIVELLASHAGVAIENARLYAQVRELTLLRERERIGRDLHDGIIQDIYAGTLQIENLADDLPEDAAEDLRRVADHFSGVIRDVRTYIEGLRPRELQGRLLPEGIALLVQDVNERGGPVTQYLLEGEPYRLPDAVANTLLHITREALSNVARHARATRAQVRLGYDSRGVTLTVADDGIGFDPEERRGPEHQGLRNLRTRVKETGGTLNIVSQPGAGTTISVRVPSPQ